MPKERASESSNVDFLLSALSHATTELRIDWNAVAAENGIGYSRNAASKFKDIVSKYGYKMEQNKLIKVDEDSTAGPSTPKTPATPRGGRAEDKGKRVAAKDTATTPVNKKRKLNQVGELVQTGYAGEPDNDDDNGAINDDPLEFSFNDLFEDDYSGPGTSGMYYG